MLVKRGNPIGHRWLYSQSLTKFRPASSPKPVELKALLDRIIKRVIRRLERDGLLIVDEEQHSLDFNFVAPTDTEIAASKRNRIAIGPHSGSRTSTLHDPAQVSTSKPVKALTINRDGFSLNAAVACQHYQRERLARFVPVCYATACLS
jgi:hypothetical protein